MVTVPGYGGGICNVLAGAPAIKQLRLLQLVAAEQGADLLVPGSNGHTATTEEGPCLQTLCDILDSLLAVPSCNPLHICFFNPKFGPH